MKRDDAVPGQAPPARRTSAFRRNGCSSTGLMMFAMTAHLGSSFNRGVESFERSARVRENRVRRSFHQVQRKPGEGQTTRRRGETQGLSADGKTARLGIPAIRASIRVGPSQHPRKVDKGGSGDIVAKAAMWPRKAQRTGISQRGIVQFRSGRFKQAVQRACYS